MSKITQRVVQTIGAAALVLGGTVAITQPASAAAHTCSGSEEFVSSTSGSRVCFYGDTWSIKICDTASGNHPAARVYSYGETTVYHENPGYNHCSAEIYLPFEVALSFQARTYSGSTLVSSGNTVYVI
ncbi:hypothetical protein ABZ454_23705 [Streptomyces sp. NPDC005803]|uniref:hypothetical protein n=1 Tax=Streptomyces sp. NPDC005803 TaxID=3154297 RepID=UPI0033D8A9BB